MWSFQLSVSTAKISYENRERQCWSCGAGQQKVQAKRAVTNTSGGNGVFWLLLCNTALFVLDHIAKQSWVHSLYLFNAHPRWWQFITSAFCHTSFEHLSGNMFMLYVFGRIVEEEEGPGGVWCTYLICALGEHNPARVQCRPHAAMICTCHLEPLSKRTSLDGLQLISEAMLAIFYIHVQEHGSALNSGCMLEDCNGRHVHC